MTKSFVLMLGVLLAVCGFAQTPPQSVDRKQLDQLQTKYAKAQSFYKKAHTAVAKRMLVVTTDQLATATMTSEVLDARERYPKALGLYEEALKLDPSNKEAMNNAEMIDSVYKGMIAKSRAKLKANPQDKVAGAQLARLVAIYKKIGRPLP